MPSPNTLAKTLKALHTPGSPLVLTNIYDHPTASLIAALPKTKAVATASYAVARSAGLADNDLDLVTNLAAVSLIGKVCLEHNKPLTVDLQDGYGEQLEEAIRGVIERGGVGCNIEDCDKESGEMMGEGEAVERLKQVLRTAREKGVEDFVVNARCDTLVHGGELEEVVRRGKKYLAAGATTVFVWGGSKRGVRDEEVRRLAEAFGGMLNVNMKILEKGTLGVEELAGMGVARISIGPALQFRAMDVLREEAEKVLSLSKA